MTYLLLKKDDNFIPDPETYIHRVGRTARAGRSGIAISLVHDQPTYNQLRFIQNHLQKRNQPNRRKRYRRTRKNVTRV